MRPDLAALLTLTLGEDVRVEILRSVGAARRQVAKLAAVDGRQGVDRQSQRGLGEGRLHVAEIETVRVFPVQLEYFIPCV